MKKSTLILALCLTGTVLGGCPKQYEWSCPSLQGQDNNISSIEPKEIIVQIDGTPSMQGFVSNQDSRYIRTLRLLRSAATSAFPSTPSPAFYAYGTQRLKTQIDLEQAEKPSFYNGSRPELLDAATYRIVKLESNDSPNALNVIVTDLYQEKAQWESLVANLKDNYLLKDNYAIGIIGVNSEFFGNIYDVGLKGISYKNIKANNRPFYILVLGSYLQVKKYFDGIKAGSKTNNLNIPDENFIIFSTRIVDKPFLLDLHEKEPSLSLPSNDLETKQKQLTNALRLGVKRVDLVNDGNVLVNLNPNHNNKVERLIVTSQKSEANLQSLLSEYKVNFSPLPYTLPLINSLDYKLNNASDFNQKTQNFTSLQDDSQQLPITLTNWEFIDKSQFKFNALIDLNNTPQSQGVYRLVFDIFPNKISSFNRPYKAPTWWTSWSFGEKEFGADKTYNLQPFLYNLGDTTFRIIENKGESLAIGRLCFIVQKK